MTLSRSVLHSSTASMILSVLFTDSTVFLEAKPISSLTSPGNYSNQLTTAIHQRMNYHQRVNKSPSSQNQPITAIIESTNHIRHKAAVVLSAWETRLYSYLAQNEPQLIYRCSLLEMSVHLNLKISTNFENIFIFYSNLVVQS